MRSNLVIVRCGAASRHNSWTGTGNRSWDLAVCPYEPVPAGLEDIRSPHDIAKPKYAGLFDYLGTDRFWRNYEYVWCPDDDLEASPAAIDAMFERCRQTDAGLAAPSLTQDSYYSHVITLANANFAYRQTTFVEMMMPCFRVDALGDLLPSFEGGTGLQWGIDFCWARRLDYRGIYIFDDAPVRHGRPVGDVRSRGEGARARRAMLTLLAECDASVLKLSLSGRLRDGTELDRFDPRFMQNYIEGYAWLNLGERAIERELVAPQRLTVPPE